MRKFGITLSNGKEYIVKVREIKDEVPSLSANENNVSWSDRVNVTSEDPKTDASTEEISETEAPKTDEPATEEVAEEEPADEVSKEEDNPEEGEIEEEVEEESTEDEVESEE